MMKKILFAVMLTMFFVSVVSMSVFSTDEVLNDTVTWETLEERIRGGNLTLKALEENIESIEVVDYNSMYNTLKNQLNQLSASQEFFVLTGQGDKVDSIAQAYASIRATYDDIRDGKLQRDSESAVTQLRDAQDQLVVAGQSLYISIISLESALEDGERGIGALERTLTELRLREKFGQVSKKVVEDIEKTKKDAESGLATLRSTITSCKAQLQLLMGCEPTGKLELGEIPKIDYAVETNKEADVLTAKENSSSLKLAKISLDKSKESYDDAEADYVAGNIPGYQRSVQRHLYEAEKLNYESAVSSFEYSFDEIYRSVINCRQVLENKQDAVQYQGRLLEIAQKQYELGRISYFALLQVQDNLESAKSEAAAAELDYFTAVNKYNNAVKYGIVG